MPSAAWSGPEIEQPAGARLLQPRFGFRRWRRRRGPRGRLLPVAPGRRLAGRPITGRGQRVGSHHVDVLHGLTLQARWSRVLSPAPGPPEVGEREAVQFWTNRAGQLLDRLLHRVPEGPAA